MPVFLLSFIFLLSLIASDAAVINGGCIRVTPTSETSYSDSNCQVPIFNGQNEFSSGYPGGQGGSRGGNGGTGNGGGYGNGGYGGGNGGGWTAPGGLGVSGPAIVRNIQTGVNGVMNYYASLQYAAAERAALYSNIPYDRGMTTSQQNAERAKETQKRTEKAQQESLAMMQRLNEEIRQHSEPILAELREEHKKFDDSLANLREAALQDEQRRTQRTLQREEQDQERRKANQANADANQLDANGLLQRLSEQDERLKDRVLSTSSVRPYGKMMRKTLNQALSIKAKEPNLSKAYQDADMAIELLLEADELFAQTQDSYQSVLAGRKIEQGVRLVKSLAGEEFNESLSPELQKQWGLPAVDGTTFEGAEIIAVVKEASGQAVIFEDEILHFHFASAVQQASADANDGDTRSVLASVNRAWAVVDYAKGFTRGLADFTVDTVTGVASLVRHPVDSAQAIYNSVVNYDKTFDAIHEAMKQIWNEYDDYTPEQKGHLHAKITAEILSTVLPVGAIKNAAKAARAAKLAKAAEKVVGKLMPLSEASVSAYEAAKAGGKHHQWFNLYQQKAVKELEKGIKSIKKQIEAHEAKIIDPKKHVTDWNKLDPRHQHDLVNKKWPSDIIRQQEQLNILEELLKSRQQ